MANIGHTLSPISPLAHDHGSNSLSALSDTDPNASLHNVCCGGCKNPIESEGGGGVVVAFGYALLAFRTSYGG